MRKLVFTMVVAAVVAFMPGVTRAQDQRDPGHVDIAQVESRFDEEPKLEVNVRGALLRMVAEASKYEDPELSEMLYGLRAIQIRGFDVRGRENEFRQRSSEFGKRLEARGWETVVRIRDDGEQVHMYLLTRNDEIDGVVVLAVDEHDEEAVFVNIVGNIDPEQIGRIGRKFNLGILDDRYDDQ
jgi:hypothetical protein